MPSQLADPVGMVDLKLNTDARQLLRDDDNLLRQIFVSVLKHHHPNLGAYRPSTCPVHVIGFKTMI